MFVSGVHIQIKAEVEMWIRQQEVNFYDCRIQKFVLRLKKALENSGRFVEN